MTERVRRGRPTIFPSKIVAPPDAMELYRLIAKLQRSDAFDECHIYTGASLSDEPMIKWHGKVTSLPGVVCSFIGMPKGLNQCGTPDCCNPFHWVPREWQDDLLVQSREHMEAPIESGLDDWVDLIDYEADKRMVRVADLTVPMVREWIPIEDLSDEQITMALNKMQLS